MNKFSEKQRRKSEYQKQYMKKRKSKGLCLRCGKIKEQNRMHVSRCIKCNKKYNAGLLGKRELREVNSTREFFSLRKIVQKERECLKCNEKFISSGINNRLCDLCNEVVSQWEN